LKALILLAIGVFVGVFCTLAATNALAKRNAHARAVMVVLARHMDELRRMAVDADCEAGARYHVEQIASAAGDIDFAFPMMKDDTRFSRRSAHFRDLAVAATSMSCANLPDQVSRLADDCTACHRQFR